MIVRKIAMWGNVLYAVAAVVALVVLLGLGSAPWRAYANVVGFIVIACAAAGALQQEEAAAAEAVEQRRGLGRRTQGQDGHGGAVGGGGWGRLDHSRPIGV